MNTDQLQFSTVQNDCILHFAENWMQREPFCLTQTNTKCLFKLETNWVTINVTQTGWMTVDCTTQLPMPNGTYTIHTNHCLTQKLCSNFSKLPKSSNSLFNFHSPSRGCCTKIMTRRDKTLDIQEHKQIFLFFLKITSNLVELVHTHTHIL